MAKEGHAAGSQQTAKEVPISESVLALAYLYFYIWYTIYILRLRTIPTTAQGE